MTNFVSNFVMNNETFLFFGILWQVCIPTRIKLHETVSEWTKWFQNIFRHWRVQTQPVKNRQEYSPRAPRMHCIFHANEKLSVLCQNVSNEFFYEVKIVLKSWWIPRVVMRHENQTFDIFYISRRKVIHRSFKKFHQILNWNIIFHFT